MVEFFFFFFISTTTILLIGYIAIYIYLRKQYNFWEQRGVSGPKPEWVFGNMKDLLNLKITEAELAERLYNEFPDEPYVGIYSLWKPILLLKDINLIKKILISDFDHFTDHPDMRGHSHSDSIFDSIFSMKGFVWKERREFISRIFTPKKIKDYIKDMKQSLNILMDETEKTLTEDCDLSHLMEGHLIRSICSILYGLDLSSDGDRIAKLTYYSNKFSFPTRITAIKFLFHNVAPKFIKFFNISIYPESIWHYFSNLTSELLNSRCQNKIERNDLLEMVIKMKNENILESGSITFEEAVGHVYIFFTGFHHTAELAVSHVLLQLSLHPEIQEKLIKEIDDVLEGSTDITYEHLNKMIYMDCIISETLRMHTLAGVLKRVCTKPYKIDKLTIPVDTEIIIPAASIHMDPQHFSEPEKFLPERFLNSNKNSFTMMPFGKGPRLCIGKRIGEIFIKLVLAKILSNYVILKSEKMIFPLKFNPKIIIITSRPIGGIWVKLKRRDCFK